MHYVYILASKPQGVLYTGSTHDLVKRMHEHREGAVEGFSKRYWVKRLVWFEVAESENAAVTRERQIKEWKRAWKIELIEKENPTWRDLWDGIVG